MTRYNFHQRTGRQTDRQISDVNSKTKKYIVTEETKKAINGFTADQTQLKRELVIWKMTVQQKMSRTVNGKEKEKSKENPKEEYFNL